MGYSNHGEDAKQGCWALIVLIGIISSIVSLCSDDNEGEKKGVVRNSPWDASVFQVENYLKRGYLKDPGSYQGIDWSDVKRQSDGGYIVRHKYRAKNSFGGYVTNNQIFYLDSKGRVYKVQDCY